MVHFQSDNKCTDGLLEAGEWRVHSFLALHLYINARDPAPTALSGTSITEFTSGVRNGHCQAQS